MEVRVLGVQEEVEIAYLLEAVWDSFISFV
jgi:hypothetical protein